MPLMRGQKRRADPNPRSANDEPSDAASSPEPASQRRRISQDANDDAYGNDNDNAQSDSSHAQLVKKMVRLALACELQRKPIRRADISEKVLGSNAGRKFREVFNAAQVELRSVFGMEMIELPSRERYGVSEKRKAAQKSQSQAASKPTTTSWVLVSTLPAVFKDPDVLPPTAAPSEEVEDSYIALYTLLIATILLSGGTLPEAKMERVLRRLGIEDRVPVDLDKTGDKTETLFKRMERDGYVYKIKEATGTGEDDIYYVVGPRGKVEVGEMGVQGLVKAVYGNMDEAEEAELERKMARSLGLGEVQSDGHVIKTQARKSGRRKKSDEDAEEDASEGD